MGLWLAECFLRADPRARQPARACHRGGAPGVFLDLGRPRRSRNHGPHDLGTLPYLGGIRHLRPGPGAKLSPREIECLQWAAAGKSDTDIAALVGVKPATAHFHIEQAKKRLGVKSRVEAVAVGVLQGII
ncbi:MAG TPA: helix-turn-helix domain-containing protein [Xanthobacteraceae bacterium]